MEEVSKFVEQYGVNRRHTNSVKWDNLTEKFGTDELLPMWVADMEFSVPEEVQAAMLERINHGVFGYTVVPDSYYEAFFNWQQTRYQVALKKEWVRFSPGVVSSFYWMVNAFTKETDGVIILSPVYYPFYDAIKDTKRTIVTSNLVNTKGAFTIDFTDFEAKIVAHQVKLFIHCSPHNPVGRVWSEAELTKLFAICQKHDVLIVSDEIHQDITRPDCQYVAALALGETYHSHLIVVNAPSKTFNMAALLNSHIIIPDEQLRKKYDNYALGVNKATNSLMGLIATEAAYRNGEAWLSGLLGVIEHNYALLQRIFSEGAPEIILSEKEGTYLAWLDLTAYVPGEKTTEFMQSNCGLATDYGEWFGEGYEGYIRINLATQPTHIEYAANKIVAEIKQLKGFVAK